MPTPIAAVAAASMASRNRGGMPQAANAAHAEPAFDARSDAARSDTAPNAVPSADDAARRSSNVEQPRSAARAAEVPVPAYASGPKRTGLALSLLIAFFVVTAGAFFAWRMLAPGLSVPGGTENDGRATVVTTLPADAKAARAEGTPGSERRQAEASSTSAQDKTGAQADASVASTGNLGSAPPGPATGDNPAEDKLGVAAPATQSPPVEITPLPAKPAARAARRPSPEREPQRAAAAPSPANTAPAAASAPTAPPVVIAAAPKSGAAAADPWARMREELATCTREDFISRVVCSQRVRFRYCGDYWGKVPECPGNPSPDHGQ